LTIGVSNITLSNENINLVISENGTEKKNTTVWSNNGYSDSWNMSATGQYEYIVTLAGHEVCKETVTVTGAVGIAQSCKFANTSRVYGEKVKFQVEKLKVLKDATWELNDPNGTKVAEGTYNQRYNQTFWEIGDINVKASGIYTLKLNGIEACLADVSVTQPSAENCRLDATRIPTGSTTSLCNGSFNCISVPKADCFFKYNNGGQTVTGPVPAGTQLQICVGPNMVDAKTTLKGTNADGNFSSDLWIQKNQTICSYFEASSTSGSYTFSVEYDESEVCNSSPTLVVE